MKRMVAGESAMQQRDVTGVLLTMGERGTHRALASMRAQAPALADVIVISGVSPFSAALNRAAGQVRTPFFVQVDSDMTLETGCVRTLREAMAPDVGITAGLLRDPLMGEVGAVKLFRRACFETVRLRDTVATDVDFYREIWDEGWLTIYVLGGSGPARTLGEHRPAYSASYTYATYYLLGARYWQQRDPTTLRWRFRRLRRSEHPLAALARMALGHGLFSEETRDIAKESVRLRPGVLRALARPDTAFGTGLANRSLESLEPETACDLFFERGRLLGARGAYGEVQSWLRQLGAATDADTWPPEAALSHGFLSVVEGHRPSSSPWERLRELL